MRTRTRLTAPLLAAFAIALAPCPAVAAPRLLFGFADNAAMDVGLKATTPAGVLGAQGYVFSLTWRPGETGITSEDTTRLMTALSAVAKTHHPVVRQKQTKKGPKRRVRATATGGRVILSIQTLGNGVPLDDTARNAFCTYARSALAAFPKIKDIVVGNEPNANWFWRPQFTAGGMSASPAAYEALLARCYDVLHAFRPKINVGAPATSPAGNDDPNAYSNVSHSPTTFILDMAAAYRASGRTRPLFDTVVHHPYGWNNVDRPYLMHPSPNIIAEGDWNRLVSTYRHAFAGTAQSVPGRCRKHRRCVPIWYLETGFQTTPPVAAPFYFGVENVTTIPAFVSAGTSSRIATARARDQATQVRDALRLAYCQPYVGAIFNFLVRDDPNLVGYQSGVLWADWTPKPSYGSIRRAVAGVQAGHVSCAAPSAPKAVAGQVMANPTRVELTWHPAKSQIGVSGYSVYRNGRLLGTTADPQFEDATTVAGHRYTYRIRAFNAAGKTGGRSRRFSIVVH